MFSSTHYFSFETLPFSFSPPFLLLRRVKLQFGPVDLKGRNWATEKYSIGWILLLLADAAISPIPLLQDRGPAPSLHGPNGAFYTAPTCPQIGPHLHPPPLQISYLDLEPYLPWIIAFSVCADNGLKPNSSPPSLHLWPIETLSQLFDCLSIGIKFICPVNTLSQHKELHFSSAHFCIHGRVNPATPHLVKLIPIKNI